MSQRLFVVSVTRTEDFWPMQQHFATSSTCLSRKRYKKKHCFLTMIFSTTYIDFKSPRRLETSSPTSPSSFCSLSPRHFRFKLYSWHLLRGFIDYEGDAYGPPDSFISKSYAFCRECPSVKKVLFLSNVFCDVLVYGLASVLLAFLWERIPTPSGSNSLLECSHSQDIWD